MTIKEIYEKFDAIGCLTFATINEKGFPETRIAHLRGFDDDGIYFMTMFTKDFYKQLKAKSSVSICGLRADTKVSHDENGMPIFDCGYAIRMTGMVEEVSIEELAAKNNPIFDFCLKDHEKYKAMVVFCIKSAYGDIFDYDFEKSNRDNKLERNYFSYNGGTAKHKGLKIHQEKCISCGLCLEKCSFLAIEEFDGKYFINNNRCDECGDCFLACPAQAISY